jgi:hypothetical protein
MSASETTLAQPLGSWRSGREEMEIQVRAPSARRRPMTCSRWASPVRAVTSPGWSSRPQGLPSSWIVSRWPSRVLAPIIRSTVLPRMRAAEALAARTSPTGESSMTPSDSVSTTER